MKLEPLSTAGMSSFGLSVWRVPTVNQELANGYFANVYFENIREKSLERHHNSSQFTITHEFLPTGRWGKTTPNFRLACWVGLLPPFGSTAQVP